MPANGDDEAARETTATTHIVELNVAAAEKPTPLTNITAIQDRRTEITIHIVGYIVLR